MDIKRLRNALDEALKVAPPDTEPPYAISLLLHDAAEGGAKAKPGLVAFLEAIAAEPGLSIFNGMMHIFPGGAGRLELQMLAAWLIRQAKEVGSEQTLNNLVLYLNTNEIPCELTLVLSGLKPQEIHDLGRGISLIPWDSLKLSQQKQGVWEQFMMGWNWPTAALVREYRMAKRHVRPEDLKDQIIAHPDDTDLHDALLCLSLVGPSASQVLASWTSLPEWVPIIGIGMSFPFIEGYCRERAFPAHECRQGSELFAAFCALPNPFQSRLRLLMQRLNRAMRRILPVDSSIDLGIALEALYLGDMPDDRGELTFRLKVRAARFLGTTDADRKRIFTLVGDLYEMRSKAVHTGTVSATLRGRPVQEILAEGYSLTADTARRFILNGEPNWDTVMFGD